jgi:cobalt-precorrin-7 (C5)-methyltransferase
MGVMIVGVGPAEGYLTDRAKEIISRADVVFGSRRALKLAEPYIKGKRVEMTRFDKNEVEKIAKMGVEMRVVVLSTGDPMVSGLGSLVDGRVEPGISSVQLALARLKVDLCEVVVVDAHARESYDEIIKAARFRKKVLILADKRFNLEKLKGLEELEGMDIKRIVVLNNLGMENEEVGDSIKSDLAVIYLETDVTDENAEGSQQR